MPFDSPEQKDFVIRGLGYDPAKYDLTDDHRIVPKVQESPSVTDGTGVMTIPKLDLGTSTTPQNTPLQTFGKTFAQGAIPAVAGGLGAAGVLSALGGAASLTGAGALVGIPLMLGGGYLASRAAGGIQNAIEPAAWQSDVAQAQAENPTAATLGNVATIPLSGFRPGRNIIDAGKGLSKLATGLGRYLEPAEKAGMLNLGINAGLQPATDIAISQAEGRPMPSAGELLQSAATGALFSTPTKMGQRMGFPGGEVGRKLDATGGQDVVPQVEIDAAREAAQQALAKEEALKTANTIQPATIIDNPADVGYQKGKKFIPQNSAKDSAAAMKQLLESGAPVEERAKQVELGMMERDQAAQLLEEQQRVKAELDRQEASNLASENAARALELKQGMGPKFSETRTQPTVTTELGKQIFPDYTGVTEQAKTESLAESPADLVARRAEADLSGESRPRYQPDRAQQLPQTDTSSEPKLAQAKTVAEQLAARGLSNNPKVSMYQKFKDWGAQFAGFKLDANGEVLGQDGKPVAGAMIAKEGSRELLAKVDPSVAGLDTLPHEMLGHGFMRRLKESPKASDQAFAKKFEALVEADPEYQKIKAESTDPKYDPEEFIASQQGLEFIQDRVLGRGETEAKAFWKDLTSHLKTRFTTGATMEDFRRIFNYKAINQPTIKLGEGLSVNAGMAEQKNSNESQLEPTPGTAQSISRYGKMIDSAKSVIAVQQGTKPLAMLSPEHIDFAKEAKQANPSLGYYEILHKGKPAIGFLGKDQAFVDAAVAKLRTSNDPIVNGKLFGYTDAEIQDFTQNKTPTFNRDTGEPSFRAQDESQLSKSPNEGPIPKPFSKDELSRGQEFQDKLQGHALARIADGQEQMGISDSAGLVRDMEQQASHLGNLQRNSTESQLVPGSIRFLEQKDVSGFDPAKTYHGMEIMGRMRNKINPTEWQMLKDAGIETAFDNNKKFAPHEINEWIKNNGPQVKVETYGMEGKVSEAKKEYDKMTHEWYETLPRDKQGEYINEADYIFGAGDVKQALMKKGWSEENATKGARYKDLSEVVRKEPRDTSPRATSYYSYVSALPTNEPMPDWTATKSGKNVQRVDVVVPQKLRDNYEQNVSGQRKGEQWQDRELWSPDNLHENLPNTLGWAMIQYKTGPKGEKIAVIAEAQSRWGQDVRERKALDKTQGQSEAGKQIMDRIDHPLLRDYNRLILKAAIDQARKEGATHIMVSDAETAMMTEGHDNLHGTARAYAPEQEKEARQYAQETGGEVVKRPDGWWVYPGKIDQEPGMRLNYDTILPKIAEELTGSKGEKVSLGEHKNAMVRPTSPTGETEGTRIRNATPEEIAAVRRPGFGYRTEGNDIIVNGSPSLVAHNTSIDSARLTPNEGVTTPRSNLIFRNADGTPKTDVSGRLYPIDKVVSPQTILGKGGPNTRYSKETLLGKPFRPLRAEIDKVEQDFGPLGKTLAGDFNKGFRGFYEHKDALTGQLNGEGIVNKYLNKLNPMEWFVKRTNPDIEAVGQYMLDKSYGKTPAPLTGRQVEIEKTIRDSLLQSVALKNAEPSLKKTVADPGYYPQVPKDTVLNTLLNKVGTPEHARLVKDFTDYHRSIGTPDPAIKYKEFIDGYKKQEVSLGSQFGPIDKSAGVGIPPSWAESSPTKVMPRFNNRYARRIAYERAINNHPDILDAMDKLGGADTVKNVIQDIQGKTEYNEAWRNAAGGVVRAGMMGPLTGAKDFVSNLTLGLQHSNPLDMTLATVDAIKNVKENWRKSFDTGVNRHNFGTLEIGDGGIDAISSVLRRTRDILNSIQGRNILEQVNRTVAFGQGNFLAQAALDAAGKSRLSGTQNKFLQDFAPDWKTTKLTPDYVAQVAARYARSVQGAYDYRGLPALTQKGSLAPVLSLARWNVEKFNNFRKYVVDPAYEGNLTPLLMSTIGMFIGGTAVQKLVEEVTGKKEKTAKWSEIRATWNEPDAQTKEAIAYKLSALASLSGYAGVMGDLVKSGMDVMNKNMPSTYGNPLLEGVANAGRLTGELADALRGGNFNITADLLSQFAEDYIQGYRLAINKLSPDRQEKEDQTNRNRDLRVWKQTTGQDVSSYQGARPNPFTDQPSREFKRTQDISRAAELLPELITSAIEKSAGNPETLQSELSKLKHNSYQTMPSLEQTPISFLRYIQYLQDSQGIDKASETMLDYFRHQAINKAKSEMVPSL